MAKNNGAKVPGTASSKVTINDLRTKGNEMLKKVETDKESVSITRRGKAVARIVPLETAASDQAGVAEIAAFGSLVVEMTKAFKGLSIEATISTNTPDGKKQTRREKA